MLYESADRERRTIMTQLEGLIKRFSITYTYRVANVGIYFLSTRWYIMAENTSSLTTKSLRVMYWVFIKTRQTLVEIWWFFIMTCIAFADVYYLLVCSYILDVNFFSHWFAMKGPKFMVSWKLKGCIWAIKRSTQLALAKQIKTYSDERTGKHNGLKLKE